ncbi:hypothetical protein [Promicromonospora sp. NPDC019610]|uniref:hypothetical protein n=1 Tax=Promicromonospora sp. NPDC019610 TaxID=3364405 RepID=UPI0037AF1F8C
MTASSEIIPGHPLVDDAALLAFAHLLHGGIRPRRRTLWFALLDGERRPLPVVVPVDLVPELPDPIGVGNLGRVWHQILRGEPGASVVVVLERPGPGDPSFEDRAWHAALRSAAADQGLTVAAFFLATADGVAALAPEQAPAPDDSRATDGPEPRIRPRWPRAVPTRRR